MRKFILITIVFLLGCAATLSAQQSGVRTGTIVTIEGETYYVHNVAPRETLYSLARLYGVSERQITDANPEMTDGLKAGSTIKIPYVNPEPVDELSSRRLRRLFDTHTVNRGETLYSISRRYGIPVRTLLEDNEGLDPAALSIGQRILLRKKSVGLVSAEQVEQQIDDYVEAANSVSTDLSYHMVRRGEGLASIARQYGLSAQEIIEANNLPVGQSLNENDVIIIPEGGSPAAQITTGNTGTSTRRDSIALRWGDWGTTGRDRWGPVREVPIRDFAYKDRLEVALLLPLEGDVAGRSGRNFVEFYQGVLLAMEQAKAQGISANLSVYDTRRDYESVSRVVRSPRFAGTDVIIGPVYEENIAPAIEFAERTGAVVVSPLASLEKVRSSVLFQMHPLQENKYDKLRRAVEGAQVVIVKTSKPDRELEAAFVDMLPQGTRELYYEGNVRTVPFAEYISRSDTTVFVISCTDELITDQILAGLGSAHDNITARSLSTGKIRVVGGSHWARFGRSVDKNLFFKLNVCYVSNYHADRIDSNVASFDRQYIETYGMIPSLYSYRGYETTMLFVQAARTIGGGYFVDKLNSQRQPVLQIPYQFVGREGGGYAARDWALVCYGSDYTITVR